MSDETSRRSTGVCQLCGGTFSRTAMTRHLKRCQERLHARATAKGSRRAEYFHLEVRGADRPDYWLHLEVPVNSRLEELDRFLRAVWLECCGHLSQFIIGRTVYAGNEVLEDPYTGALNIASMDIRLEGLLKPGMTFQYEYDFGSTTALTLRVVDRYVLPGQSRRKISLLARNNPPEILCAVCGKRQATVICALCPETDRGWLCLKCVDAHGCGEEYLLPVVNSPRAGICGYTGEAVDAGFAADDRMEVGPGPAVLGPDDVTEPRLGPVRTFRQGRSNRPADEAASHGERDAAEAWFDDLSQLLFNPAAVDLSLKYLERLSGDERFKFERLEDAIRHLTARFRRPDGLALPSEPHWQALRLLAKAYDAANPDEAVKLARAALEIDPCAADAYIILAENAAAPAETLALLKEGVEKSAQAISPHLFQEYKGRLGSLLEARPYLRVRAELAECLWAFNLREESARHAQELLRLDAADYVGIRGRLLHALLLDGDYTRAESLLNAFPQDTSTTWAYSKALLLYARHGDSPTARRALREAFEVNPLVPLLVVLSTWSSATEAFTAVADEIEEADSEMQAFLGEAERYLYDSKESWERVEGAADWLFKLCTKHVKAATRR